MQTVLSESKCQPTWDKWAWHRQRLNFLRDQLMHECENQVSAAGVPHNPEIFDSADAEMMASDLDMALSLLAREKDALHELNASLVRIENGTYGVCEATGDLIPEERLQAIPWTRYTRMQPLDWSPLQAGKDVGQTSCRATTT